MARKPMGMPSGVEVRNGSIRIRFSWNGSRCSETLPYPPTQAGIQQASRLRDQVVSLNKHGLLDEAKYSELFPNSTKALEVVSNTFGVYAQSWLDSRSIVLGTRKNYIVALNNWWMPKLALTPLASITTPMMRKLLSEIEWTTQQVKSSCMSKIRTIFNSAVNDGLMARNPMSGLELPKKPIKNIDTFTQDEANKIIKYMYAHKDWKMHIHGAFIEFAFYSGIRLSEISALRWDMVDFKKKTAYVCRIVADSEIKERTKTNKPRYVLLNERALGALAFAKKYIAMREEDREFPYCFPPSQGDVFNHSTSNLSRGWGTMLTDLGIKHRPPYNARHTYATLCLMSGMNPAFIAKQLGHSVEMLLSTYAQWLSNEDDWSQMSKLPMCPNLPQDTK